MCACVLACVCVCVGGVEYLTPLATLHNDII